MTECTSRGDKLFSLAMRSTASAIGTVGLAGAAGRTVVRTRRPVRESVFTTETAPPAPWRTAAATNIPPIIKHFRTVLFLPFSKESPGGWQSLSYRQWYHFSVKWAGFVLAGGRSSRMGRDKALLSFQGVPLVARVAEMVAQAAGSAVVIGDPGKYGGLGYAVVPDRRQGLGPLAGIEAALDFSTADWNLVLACDMPDVSAAFLRALLETAAA